jgi:hypothetical protein
MDNHVQEAADAETDQGRANDEEDLLGHHG